MVTVIREWEEGGIHYAELSDGRIIVLTKGIQKIN
jgi:hypothetical protein